MRRELAEARRLALQTNGWLANAPPDLSAAFLERCSLRRLAAGEALHFEGDEPLGMYGVVDGAMKVYLSGDEDGPQFVHILAAGAWGGEGPAIINGPRPVTLVAGTASTLLFLFRPAMIELATLHPQLWDFYTFQLMSHLTTSLRAVSDLMVRDPRIRLIRVLLRLANQQALSAKNRSVRDTGPVDVFDIVGQVRVHAGGAVPLAGLQGAGAVVLGDEKVRVDQPPSLTTSITVGSAGGECRPPIHQQPTLLE